MLTAPHLQPRLIYRDFARPTLRFLSRRKILAGVGDGMAILQSELGKMWPGIFSPAGHCWPSSQKRDKEIIRREQWGPTSTTMYSQMDSRFHPLLPHLLLLVDQNGATLSVDVQSACGDCFIVLSPSCYFTAHKLKGWGWGGGGEACKLKIPLSPVCYLSLPSACDECWCFRGVEDGQAVGVAAY